MAAFANIVNIVRMTCLYCAHALTKIQNSIYFDTLFSKAIMLNIVSCGHYIQTTQ